MRSVWRFIRAYFWAIVVVAVLLPFLLYKPIVQSSPIARWDDFTVTVDQRFAPNNRLRRNPYTYYVIPHDGREQMQVTSYSLLQLGQQVTVRETIRRNGHSTYEILM